MRCCFQENSEHAEQKPLRISGSPEVVEAAKNRVMDMLNTMPMNPNGMAGRGRGMMMRGSPRGAFAAGRGRGRGGGGGGWSGNGDSGGEAVEHVLVSSDKVGLVIGKGGETIKSINQASGAYCEIDKRAPADATEKNFIIRGSRQNVERAKQMVLEKVITNLFLNLIHKTSVSTSTPNLHCIYLSGPCGVVGTQLFLVIA